MKNCFILLFVCFIIGCGPPATIEEKNHRFATYYLPTDASNIQDLGNDWHLFELEIDGEWKKFLFHNNGRSESGVESITQVQ